ncbi:MAG TPA: hypothetical protein VKZ44_09430 [Taishania sp.]|nr:hypothetical protein [Taishania sp.]
MSVKRKCKNCNHWNNDEDYCQKCGNLISPVLIEEQREIERETIRQNKPKTPFDIFLESWKNSRFLFFRAIYYVLYTIWAIVMSIAFFFAYLVLGTNG